MYTFSLFCKALALVFIVAVPALGQGLATNPTLYENADGWTLSDLAQWDSYGYDRGSIHLQSTSSISTATQCVAAEGGQAFVATARVYGACAGARFYALWAAADDCSDIDHFPGNGTTSTAVNEWEPLTVAVPARDDAHMIELKLMDVGGCSNGFYFDDIDLHFDAIYDDDFEGAHGIDTP
jgi:hypothetical protein